MIIFTFNVIERTVIVVGDDWAVQKIKASREMYSKSPESVKNPRVECNKGIKFL